LLNTPSQSTTPSVCLMQPIDPRGTKVGGLETYIRDFLKFYPEGWKILLIGIDERGDLEPGKIIDLTLRSRTFAFMPIMHYPPEEQHEAAKKLSRSITFQFVLALFARFFSIRKLLRAGRYTVDLRRVEMSAFVYLTGRPFVQMLHGEGAPRMAMDSLIRKLRFTHNMAESFAMRHCWRFLCVNPQLADRLRATYPKYASKIGYVGTWADTSALSATPFPPTDRLEMVFVGRLDAFKDPALMFDTLAELARRGVAFRFNYIGTSDPDRFSEFDRIRAHTTLHGFQDRAGLDRIMSSMHMGLLFSHFEGMPRAVLEALACGRPVVTSDLYQLKGLVEIGVNGLIVPQRDASKLADGIITVFERIKEGAYRPETIRESMLDYTPEKQLSKVFTIHGNLAAAGV